MSKRLLIFSLRNINKELFRCCDYEYEDVISLSDPADFYLPELRYKSPFLSQLSQSLSRNTLNIPWNLSFSFPKIEKNYDVFFAMLMFTHDLEVLHRMPDWRSKTGYSICYIDESFVKSFKSHSKYMRVLKRFDCLVLNCSQTKEFIDKKLGMKTLVVSSGVDAERFFPGIPSLSRNIDIYNMGRRDEQVHQQFRKLAKKDDWLYVYTTGMPGICFDPPEHRENLAGRLNRSKFFVVNPSKFDCPDDTGKQQEIGFRYYEGSAAGTVMVGTIPNNINFKRHFPWEAVVELPKDPNHVMDFMRDLKSDDEHMSKIRFNNVKGSLEQHDFVYRWEEMLTGCELEIPHSLQLRKNKLDDLKSKWMEAHS